MREACENGTIEEWCKYQHVDFAEVEKKLQALQSEDQQYNLLKYEYVSIYSLVCKIRGIDDRAFIEICKTCEKSFPQTYCYYIQGYLVPLIALLEAQGKLRHG